MVKTVNKRMRWYLERRSGSGARVLTTLLLLVLKTVGGTSLPLSYLTLQNENIHPFHKCNA